MNKKQVMFAVLLLGALFAGTPAIGQQKRFDSNLEDLALQKKIKLMKQACHETGLFNCEETLKAVRVLRKMLYESKPNESQWLKNQKIIYHNLFSALNKLKGTSRHAKTYPALAYWCSELPKVFLGNGWPILDRYNPVPKEEWSYLRSIKTDSTWIKQLDGEQKLEPFGFMYYFGRTFPIVEYRNKIWDDLGTHFENSFCSQKD